MGKCVQLTKCSDMWPLAFRMTTMTLYGKVTMTHRKKQKSLFQVIMENYNTYNCSHLNLDFFTPLVVLESEYLNNEKR